jgi:hypothetical protein
MSQRKKKNRYRPLDVWPERRLRADGLKHAGLTNPGIFSLIANPEQSLGALTLLRRTLELPTLRSINFDHTECQLLDLCASVVQDVLIMKGRLQSSFRRSGGLQVTGNLPDDKPQVKMMLFSAGIMRHLGLTSPEDIPSDLRERLRFSELRSGSASPPHLTSDSELAASELADFFDECLKIEQHQLKPALKSNLIQLITEVLDNAEQHGRADKTWYTIGYYNRHENPEEGGECHIVLFNFGDSIFESLNRDDTSPELKRQIADLAAEHERKGYFTATVNQMGLEWVPLWEEESLWTLYALQEGVSRFTNQPDGIDRGNGTVKVIEFFTELASGLPQMALLSGKTHILFDGKYRLNDIPIGSETRKVIAFNASNDLKERPDEKYVRTLSHKFPGTLLSLRFHLRRTDLSQIKGKVDALGID